MADYELIGLNEAAPDLRAPTSADRGKIVGGLYVTGLSELDGGIDVTGTATMDGLTVDGAVAINSNSFVQTAATPSYNLIESDVTNENTQIIQASGTFRIRTVDDAGSNAVERMRIDHGTGDISFYEDTGTSPKMVWKSADERLGIGTSSPAEPLHVQEGSSGITQRAGTVALIESSGNTKLTVASGATSTGEVLFGRNGDNDAGSVRYDHNTNSMQIDTNSNQRMCIDSSGNVGIGTSSPDAAAILDVQSTTKGIRFPNMTTTQKNAMANVAGMQVFDTTLSKMCFNTGSAWETITSA